jgi:predicted branched-subunit amino acid permease
MKPLDSRDRQDFPSGRPSETVSRRTAFLDGAKAVSPILLGAAPFGLVAGAAAVGADLTVAQAIGLSTVVFAGASQLAAIDLLGRDATLAVVVGTALIINARMVMYSASIAPYFERLSSRRRALVAYLLTDQAYALSITRFREHGSSLWYYLGTAAPLWVVFVAATVVGAVAGARLPAWLPLEFTIPLTFLAVLTPAIVDRASLVAAAVGGAVAVVGAGLPYNLGLLAGSGAGIAAGLLVGGETESEPTQTAEELEADP